jgi:PEP-CTERM/exosortase A-associated glycosyltransferase
MRILHLLHRSVPGTHGYAIRSREIVTHQLAKGLEPLVVTSPSQSPQGDLHSDGSETIDGIRYFRTGSRILPGTAEVQDKSPVKAALRVFQNLSLFTTAMRVARTYQVQIVHGHSPFTCGLVANAVGRRLRIPSVYEMRGIWEDSHTSRHGISDRSLRYRSVRFLENRALQGADRCCVIGTLLKQEIESRGISEEKITIVPNGVDVRAFMPGPANTDLQSRLGLGDSTVIGYIGSFFRYEGLDLLVKAMIRLSSQFPDVRLLLVGDGEVTTQLKKIAADSGIIEKIVFSGRVPHQKVHEYYRLCDIMVLPRVDSRETRLVTPLKPLEIMAMAKPLIASNIGGHRELMVDGVNGILFKAEDVDALAEACGHLIVNRDAREDLGRRARKWVESERDWNVLIERYVDLYKQLTRDRA